MWEIFQKDAFLNQRVLFLERSVIAVHGGSHYLREFLLSLYLLLSCLKETLRGAIKSNLHLHLTILRLVITSLSLLP